jgi:hypothetical protein
VDSIYRADVSALSEAEQQAYRANTIAATYSFSTFKDSVAQRLRQRFGAGAISMGTKTIKISGDSNRRSVDVLPCYRHVSDRALWLPLRFWDLNQGDSVLQPLRHAEDEKIFEEGEKVVAQRLQYLRHIRSIKEFWKRDLRGHCCRVHVEVRGEGLSEEGCFCSVRKSISFLIHDWSCARSMLRMSQAELGCRPIPSLVVVGSVEMLPQTTSKTPMLSCSASLPRITKFPRSGEFQGAGDLDGAATQLRPGRRGRFPL